MTGKIMPLRERDTSTSTIQAAVDAFVSSPRYAPNNRRAYAAGPQITGLIMHGPGEQLACPG